MGTIVDTIHGVIRTGRKVVVTAHLRGKRGRLVDRRTVRRFKQTGFSCDDGSYAGENTVGGGGGGGGGDEKVSVGAKDEPTLPNVKLVLCFTRSSFGDPGHDNRAMFTDSDMVVAVLVMDDVGEGGICGEGGISPSSCSSFGL
jgi:hypothetical protein